MTEAEAQGECARRSAEHPDRRTHQWRPRQEPDGDWSIVKIAIAPPDLDRQAEQVAAEKPPTPGDPRSAFARNVGPYAGAG